MADGECHDGRDGNDSVGFGCCDLGHAPEDVWGVAGGVAGVPARRQLLCGTLWTTYEYMFAGSDEYGFGPTPEPRLERSDVLTVEPRGAPPGVSRSRAAAVGDVTERIRTHATTRT